MRINNWSISYTVSYIIVLFGRSTYYKQYVIEGKENIPKDKPVLFASNHQNAFMDPVLIATSRPYPVYYLVRADIFKKKLVAKIFASLNMMPIYRPRDGVDLETANQPTFEQCYQLLSKKRPIIIFPEGNHAGEKKLRILKKGIGRIALGAEEKFNHELDVHIVPVGINYSKHSMMNGTLYLRYGKAIPVKDYFQHATFSEAEAQNNLRKDLQVAMGDLILDVQSKSNYNSILAFLEIFDHEIKKGHTELSLAKEFTLQKEFIAKAERWVLNNPEEAQKMEDTATSFMKECKEQGIKPYLFNYSKNKVFGRGLFLFLFAPVHLYGMVNNYLPYKLPFNFVRKIKDRAFHSSLKMALGVVLFFLFWLIQTILVAVFTDQFVWLYYLISLPLSAAFSYEYWKDLLKFKGALKYNKLVKSGEINSMRESRSALKSIYNGIIGH